MKFCITIAVVLALLALTQAQNESNQSELDSSPAAPSDGSSFEEQEKPAKPLRPIRRPFGHRRPRPQPNEDQQSDNESPEGNSPQRFPNRKPVFFDTKIDFGKNNLIRNRDRPVTPAPTP